MPTCCIRCAMRFPPASPCSACRRRRKFWRITRSIPIISPRPDFAIDLESWLERQRPYDGPALPQPQNMIYTSGTTGHPKGVRRNAPTPEQARRVGADARADLRPEAGRARAAAGAAVSFRAEFVRPARRPSRRRAGADAAVRAGGISAADRGQKIDTIFMVPTMFIRLMKLPEAVRRKYDMSSLRHVIHAAAPCPADVKRAMIEWWGPVIYEFYGSTESGAVTFANSEDALKKPGTVGKISPGAELRFVGDDGETAAAGRDRRNLFADRRQSGFHLSQQAGEARRDRARRVYHLGRCRLYRRRTAMSSSATASATW